MKKLIAVVLGLFCASQAQAIDTTINGNLNVTKDASIDGTLTAGTITGMPTKVSDLDNDSGFIPDAPADGNEYVRKDAAWAINSGGGGDLPPGTDGDMLQHSGGDWTATDTLLGKSFNMLGNLDAILWDTGSNWLDDTSTDASHLWSASKIAAEIAAGGGTGGYIDPPPTYSDEPCTPGQYALTPTLGYVCVADGDWNTFAITDWDNPTPPGECATQSVYVSQTVNDAAGNNIDGTDTEGQGIYFDTNEQVYSITMRSGSNAYSSPVYQIRIGDSLDLSTTYLGESNAVTVDTANTEYEFIFDTPVDVTAGAQYYFLVSETSDAGGAYANFARSDTDTYTPAGCTECSRHYRLNSDAKFNADGGTTNADQDYYFIIKVCD